MTPKTANETLLSDLNESTAIGCAWIKHELTCLSQRLVSIIWFTSSCGKRNRETQRNHLRGDGSRLIFQSLKKTHAVISNHSPGVSHRRAVLRGTPESRRLEVLHDAHETSSCRRTRAGCAEQIMFPHNCF